MQPLLPPAEPLRPLFQRDKYVVVPQALPSSMVQRWQEKAAHMTQWAQTIRRVEDDFELVYRVVTGDTIRSRWPELFAFYSDETTLHWIKQVTGEAAIYTSPHLQSAVNLNIMDSADSVYRWHFDAVPYTALLYLSDVVPEDGGALELVPGCDSQGIPDLSSARIVRLWPAAGTLVLMDGTRCYHRVSRLSRPTTRFSIPLVFPNRKEAQRPAGLDSYLYEAA